MCLRFITNPDVPGTEKLAVCRDFRPRDFRCPLKSRDITAVGDLAPPMCVFNAKGWTRSLAATAVLRLAYEKNEFMQAGIVMSTASALLIPKRDLLIPKP